MALLDRVRAAVDALRGNIEALPETQQAMRYGLRWSLYDGSAFTAAWREQRAKVRRDPRIYAATRLLWKHVAATVDFFATTVYQGSLSTNGDPLPGGQPEAIPIDAQVQGDDDSGADSPAGDERNAQLRLGIAEIWNATNWRQGKNLRPMYGAALGDCLTEIVDDVEGKKVVPVTIWPGYIAALELDSVGNVKYVAIEYDVHIKPNRLDSGHKEEQYRLRREMDGESFRYYKDDKLDEELPNPYRAAGEPRGFVPCIWDRHKQVWGDYGQCAFENTIQALMEVNSFLSLAVDQKRKALAAPIVIQGQISRLREGIQLQRPAVSDAVSEEAVVQAYMQRQDVLTATGNQVGLHNIPADLTEVINMLNWMKEGIQSENPEGSFYTRLGQIGNLTGPGADRALGDATSRCRWARAGYDTQSVKLFQMILAICGMRVNNGSWTNDGYQLSRRQQAWLPFGMESYRAGHLDFLIPERPVVLPTPEEVVNLVVLKESVTTDWGMREVGIDDDDIKAANRQRERDRQAQIAAFSVAGSQQDDQQRENDDTGNQDVQDEGA